jgi:hypothetical protein
MTRLPEVISTVRRRRAWSTEEKVAILDAAECGWSLHALINAAPHMAFLQCVARSARRNLDGNKRQRSRTGSYRSAGKRIRFGTRDRSDSSSTTTTPAVASSTSEIPSPSSTETEKRSRRQSRYAYRDCRQPAELTVDGQPIIPVADDSGATDAANDNSPIEVQSTTGTE